MNHKPQAIVHERHDSKEELERLFGVLKVQNSPTIPMRDRHLPQSFFSPPTSADGAGNNNTTATLSTDSNFSFGDNVIHQRIKSSPASFQYHNNNNANALYHQPLHPKHHSSSGPFRNENIHSNKPFHVETSHKNIMNPNMPMRQLPMASPAQQNGLHIRVGSGSSGLHPSNAPMQAKLPDGWEKAFTDKGQIYFVNHITRTTSWEDPRRSMMQAQNPNSIMQTSANNNVEIPNTKAMQELQMMQLERKQLEQKREEMLRKESEIKRQLSFQRQQISPDQFAHRSGLATTAGRNNGVHNPNATLIKHEPTSPSPMQVDSYQSPQQQHTPMDIQANLSQGQMMNYHTGNMPINAQLPNGGLHNQPMMSETGNEPDIEELIQSLNDTAQVLDIDANLMDRDAIAKIESELVDAEKNWY